MDLLEPVEVDEHQCAGATRPGETRVELELEAPAVEQPGERIDIGEVAQFVLDALALGDVLDLDDDVTRATVVPATSDMLRRPANRSPALLRSPTSS